MTTPWTISAGVTRVELQDGRGAVTFTVSNPGPVDDRAVLDVVSSDGAQASWFTVDEPQRRVPHGGSVTASVEVKPGDGAAGGDYWLAGRVYSADSAPEETAVTSDRVSFTVGEPVEEPKSRWWLWAIPAAAMVLIVAGVVAFLVLRGGATLAGTVVAVRVPDVVGQTEAAATQAIEDLGLTAAVQKGFSRSTQQGLVARTNPRAGTPVAEGSDVTVIVSLGPLPTPTFVPPTVVEQP